MLTHTETCVSAHQVPSKPIPPPTLLHHQRECKMVWPLWETMWKFLKTLKAEVAQDPAMPLLGIYRKKMKNPD